MCVFVIIYLQVQLMLVVLICALLRQSVCLPHRRRDRGVGEGLGACALPPSQVFSLCHTHYKLILLKTVLPPSPPIKKSFLRLCAYMTLSYFLCKLFRVGYSFHCQYIYFLTFTCTYKMKSSLKAAVMKRQIQMLLVLI